MTKLYWLIFNILPMIGFFLAVMLLVYQNRTQRSPSSTVAWLLAILLVPYVGVPAYIILGGRKMRRMTRIKGFLTADAGRTVEPSAEQGVRSIFPLRSGNEASLLATGEQAYAALMDLIEQARTSIDVTTFYLGNDKTGNSVLAALARKAGQGVRVRLLLDALGSFRTSRKQVAPLLANGGSLAYFMPMMHLPFRGRANLRNHRKMVIVDRATALFGGMNIAQEYMGPTVDKRRWYDMSMIVKGPVVADLHQVFCSDWQFAAGQSTVPEAGPGPIAGNAATALQLVPSGPDVDGDPLYESILTALFTARQRVWITTPYFIPDEMLLKAIGMAAKRGVDVRIVVPEVSNHRLADLVRRSYLRQMHESGAVVCQFQPGVMHGKVILVDTSLCIVGSMNMDVRSFFLNYEIAMFIYDTRLLNELERWIDGLISQSFTGIRKTNVMIEFLEGVVRLLSPLL
ncbi:MAG: hypothetical protein A2498_12455 [Lentisphaerae bacterium RIFOXYC12_FULL_60_16]|nr:MAG: hypothetical protein A2498_12455 [Lentisphaerae bacterium RIFOXYC12_FULL_60_16]OGV72222.1 MAG: hypothetical protein A2269_06525 [Lentisphaerae bacterium RIFOXYA12_FULL_60_10]OGV83589.1 MAG: hypothetical protein A2340_09505 [Lentisphaerae bacterium RIFOXYB12_FULL_60_10]